jgi:hypothetical protein
MLDGMAHFDNRSVCPRQRARDKYGVIVAEYLYHGQIGNRGSAVAHLTGHSQPFENASGIRTIADRAAMTEVFVSPVRTRETGKMMAFDDPRVTVPFGYTANVDPDTSLEYFSGGEILSQLELSVAGALELAYRNSRRNLALGEMAPCGLAHAGVFFATEGKLDRFVTVGRTGLELGYDARTERYHRDRPHAPDLVRYLGHPELLSD